MIKSQLFTANGVPEVSSTWWD